MRINAHALSAVKNTSDPIRNSLGFDIKRKNQVNRRTYLSHYVYRILFLVVDLLCVIAHHHHHYQPINVPTAGAQASLMD
jgi:hypothetical protein